MTQDFTINLQTKNSEYVDLTQEETCAREAEEIAAQQKKEAEEYIYNRRSEYPPIGDQLDAIWKQLNQDRLGGDQLIQEVDDMLGKILAVKNKYPKPEQSEE